MKRFYVLIGSIVYATLFAIGIGDTLSNVWAGAYPVEEEQQVEPLGVVQYRDLTVVRPINVGEAYFNGQLQTVQQVGDTLYLQGVNRAVDLQPGEEPITIYGSIILFKPTDGTARTIDFTRDGYEAAMPGIDVQMPGIDVQMPGINPQ